MNTNGVVRVSLVLLAAGALAIAACVGDNFAPSSDLGDGGGTAEGGGGGDEGGVGTVKNQGDPCSPADTCRGSTCVDGYCCSTACTDTCSACNVKGHEGTCHAVPVGAPAGKRLCLGDTSGACTGSCDGVNGKDCTYPTVACGTGTCSAGKGTPVGMCAMGVCDQPSTLCGDSLCGDGGCTSVAQVAVGQNFACALLTDKTVRCWGDNTYGQLGQGGTDKATRLVPTPVPGFNDIIAIGAGDLHVCAVRSDTSVWCWGANYAHQLGLGEATNVVDPVLHATPLPVCASGTGATCAKLTNVAKVVGGAEATCAIVGQSVKCWGENGSGELGSSNPPATPATATPQTVGAGNTATCANATSFIGQVGGGIADIAMGGYFACAIQGDGNAVFCWGDNNSGQVGQNFNTVTRAPCAVSVPAVNVGLQKPKLIAAWSYGACAIVTDGTAANNLVRCWGNGSSGERGNNSTTADQSVTTMLGVACAGNFTGATAITAGGDGNNGSAVCAVAGGTVYCTGDNLTGELGTGSLAPTSVKCPGKSLLTAGVVDVAAGASAYGFCARLNAGGAMRCWGSRKDGFLGNGTNDTVFAPTPVAQTW